MKRSSIELSALTFVAASLATINQYPSRPRPQKRPTDDSEALKSANAKINAIRQDRRVHLLKEREVRNLNFRERRELERNIYAEY